MTEAQEKQIVSAIDVLVGLSHVCAISKGFTHYPDQDGEKIALMHAELSEALEALRTGDAPSDHIPEFSGSEEEFADVILRLANFAGARGQRLGLAVVAKHKYNLTRPYKHGKKF